MQFEAQPLKTGLNLQNTLGFPRVTIASSGTPELLSPYIKLIMNFRDDENNLK